MRPIRSEDVHGTVAKLRRDVPRYLYGGGTKGNIMVFEVDELQRFLSISIFSKDRVDSVLWYDR